MRPRKIALVATVLGVALTFAIPASARSGGETGWARAYAGTCASTGQAVAADPAKGRVYALADTGCTTSRADLVAYTDSGAHLWTATGTGDDDLPVAVQVDPASHTIVTAGVRNGADLLVQAWSSNGHEVWGRTLGATNSFVTVVGLAIDDGRVFVGATISKNGSGDFLTAAYDLATGTPLWHTRAGGSSEDDEEAVAITADDVTHRVYLTGTDFSLDASITVGLRESDGAEAAGGSQNHARTVAMVIDSQEQRIYLLVDSDDGTVQVLSYGMPVVTPGWVATFAGTDDESDVFGAGLALDPVSHRVYLSATQDQDEHAVLAAVSSSGTVLWSDGDTTAAPVLPSGLVVDPGTHRVYVSGTRFVSHRLYRIVTWADGAAGHRAWHSVRGSAGLTSSGGLADDPNHAQVYVVGTTPKSDSTGALTIAYAV